MYSPFASLIADYLEDLISIAEVWKGYSLPACSPCACYLPCLLFLLLLLLLLPLFLHDCRDTHRDAESWRVPSIRGGVFKRRSDFCAFAAIRSRSSDTGDIKVAGHRRDKQLGWFIANACRAWCTGFAASSGRSGNWKIDISLRRIVEMQGSLLCVVCYIFLIPVCLLLIYWHIGCLKMRLLVSAESGKLLYLLGTILLLHWDE